MSAEDDLRNVRQRVEQARALRARREAERDAAQATLTRAKGELQAEFGVGTVEDARALLGRLEADLAEQVRAVSAELEKV